MQCMWPRQRASVRQLGGRSTAQTRHALLLLVACLLLLAAACCGAAPSALAAEEHAAAAVVAPVAQAATTDHAHAEPPFDARADFHDEAAATEAATTTQANAESSPASPDEFLDLDSLSETELKALLSDKKNGQVNFKRYKGRDDLIHAIREAEKKERAQKAFLDEVAAAARWYVETQEEKSYQRAAARRARSSRIKHEGGVPATLRSGSDDGEEPKHDLRVLYSEANGYGKNFAELVKDLESSATARLPNLNAFRVVGEPYPISKETAMMSQALQVCFYGVLALAVVPDLVPFIPAPVRDMIRTRRSLVISTAFMLNMLGRSLLQNNAFEVYFDDELIYSAIKLTGRLPTSEMVSKMLLERTLLKDYAAAKV